MGRRLYLPFILNKNSRQSIASLFAHEFRHYLQYKKYNMIRRNYNGRRVRPIQVERDARKWAERRINKLKKEGKL
ncbi:MAG: DUF3920 family protein [Promethearchaeota archaeon]